MLRLAFDFIITWRETRTRPNAYFFKYSLLSSWPFTTYTGNNKRKNKTAFVLIRFLLLLIRKIFC